MRSITTDFFWFCCGCLVVSLAYVSIVRDFSFEFVTYGVSKFAILALSMVTEPWIPLAVPLIVLMIWRDRPRALETLGAGLGTIILSVAFAMSKSAIPTVVPFWADPILTDIDMLIFNGQHAYQWVHTMGAGWLDPTGAADSYVQTWGALTLFFPVILTAADSNIERRQRYLMVYGLIWALLGVVLATLMSSAGPIFADAITGETHFSDLPTTLSASGLDGTYIDFIQKNLWDAYTYDNGAQIGSTGISAFPSLHVAMGALWCFYMCERSVFLAPIGIAFAATIWVLSIYSGYHYATDGLASIILVALLIWAVHQFKRVENVAGPTH
jgi:hypothetical protein